jgi:thiosulfate dehydrogenase [quinone] large subunit
LLLLRAFLGVTFSVAGLQKLANPNFFRASAPGSFVAQVRGAVATSPLHHLLDPALHAPVAVALVIAVGELAVGLGTLVGLLGRVAAIGGMVFSLLFFLAVSFNDQPYYYGPDIVFLFAWTPLVIGGSGHRSLDAWYAQRRRALREAIVAAGAQNSAIGRRRAAELERRVVLQRFAAVGVLGALGALLGGITAGLGRLLSSSALSAGVPQLGSATTPSSEPATTTTTSSQPTTTTPAGPTSTAPPAPPKGTRIGPASSVPVGGAASFTDPAQGIPAFVVQPAGGRFGAFSAICTHAGCQVQFDRTNESFVCPCHGSVFSARNGDVLAGPAPSPLPSIPVALGPGGQLYVDG